MSRVEIVTTVIDDDGTRNEVKWTFGNVPGKPSIKVEPDQPYDDEFDPFRLPRPVEKYDFKLELTARPDETGECVRIEWQR
jgi:hypothetical protein